MTHIYIVAEDAFTRGAIQHVLCVFDHGLPDVSIVSTEQLPQLAGNADAIFLLPGMCERVPNKTGHGLLMVSSVYNSMTDDVAVAPGDLNCYAALKLQYDSTWREHPLGLDDPESFSRCAEAMLDGRAEPAMTPDMLLLGIRAGAILDGDAQHVLSDAYAESCKRDVALCGKVTTYMKPLPPLIPVAPLCNHINGVSIHGVEGIVRDITTRQFATLSSANARFMCIKAFERENPVTHFLMCCRSVATLLTAAKHCTTM